MYRISYRIVYVILLILGNYSCTSEERILNLWPEGQIPNHIETSTKEIKERTDILRIKNVQEPTIEVFLPNDSIATGKAMLIFPGGGYGILAYEWEGTEIATYLNSNGIAGIVVKYRLPSDETQIEKQKVPLIDAQRAIRLVRSKANFWNIDENQIGVIGFSAGGHLASTLGTQYNKKMYLPVDSVDDFNARPDFMALIYPVITMGEKTHLGSRDNLLGKNPSQKLVNTYSSELHVNERTPTTFLLHATDDKAVPQENSEYFHAMLSANGIGKNRTVLHLYDTGGHGFGLAKGTPHLQDWPQKLVDWLSELN